MSAKNALEEKQSRRRGRNKSEEIPEEEEELVEDRGLTERKGRATPSRRVQQAEDAKSGNFITRRVRGLLTFFGDVRSELAKVTWPTRQQTATLTRIVLITIVASALALGVISLIFSELFRIGMNTPIVLVAIIVLASLIAAYYIRAGSRRTTY